MTIIDRKRLIINAATQSFGLFGFKATTMDQVSRMANVGKGTIYTFFTTKDELFQEIINKTLKEMKLEADKVIDNQQGFISNLHSVLHRMLEFRTEHQFTAKIFQEAKEIGTPAVLQAVSRVEGSIISVLKMHLDKAIENGEIKNCNSELMSFLMLKMYVALIVDWEKNHQPLLKEEMADLFEMYFFKGLSK